VDPCDSPADVSPSVIPLGCTPTQMGILARAMLDICQKLLKKCKTHSCLESEEIPGLADCIKKFCTGRKPVIIECLNPWSNFSQWLLHCVFIGASSFAWKYPFDWYVGVCPAYFNCVNKAQYECCAAMLFHELVHLCDPSWQGEREERADHATDDCYPNSYKCYLNEEGGGQ